ncbi:hypothetical protein BX070DRAFT_229978 [Coemansia spiralis]|nr:hypothetical protein BX070DRAFT_229978 [Coemansia spiralis]
MDGFHYVYNNQFAGAPMASTPSYPNVSGPLDMVQPQYPFPSRSSPAPAYASRVLNDPESIIYCHDPQTNGVSEYGARQTMSAEGTVFIEHIPGYSLLFVSNSTTLDHALCDIARTLRPVKPMPRVRETRASKPCNPFIMYRNFKIKEMRIQNPDINQTDISREAARWWKEESDEVKDMFRSKYREEKQSSGNKKRKLGIQGTAVGLKPRARTMPTYTGLSIVTDLRKQLVRGFDACDMSAHTSSPMPSIAESYDVPPLSLGSVQMMMGMPEPAYAYHTGGVDSAATLDSSQLVGIGMAAEQHKAEELGSEGFTGSDGFYATEQGGERQWAGINDFVEAEQSNNVNDSA